MPKTSSAPSRPATSPSAPVEVYSPRARMYHWMMVPLLFAQIPIGIYMVYRGSDKKVVVGGKEQVVPGIWDGVTNTLYDSHKLIGVTILLLVLARLYYRFSHGAPADEPTLEPWQKVVSHITHWAIYALLVVVAIGGYLGVSYYGAAKPFGIPLPVFVAKNEDTANAIFALHRAGGLLLAGLIAMHIGAALFHHLIRKDNVLRRMIGTPR